jgi:hypothetical protein
LPPAKKKHLYGIIQQNKQHYGKRSHEFTEAVDTLGEYCSPEESWNIVAPQTEQARSDEVKEGAY